MMMSAIVYKENITIGKIAGIIAGSYRCVIVILPR
jgi:hypothetical protein